MWGQVEIWARRLCCGTLDTTTLGRALLGVFTVRSRCDLASRGGGSGMPTDDNHWHNDPLKLKSFHVV